METMETPLDPPLCLLLPPLILFVVILHQNSSQSVKYYRPRQCSGYQALLHSTPLLCLISARLEEYSVLGFLYCPSELIFPHIALPVIHSMPHCTHQQPPQATNSLMLPVLLDTVIWSHHLNMELGHSLHQTSKQTDALTTALNLKAIQILWAKSIAGDGTPNMSSPPSLYP